ncbi:MAG: porin family protein [Bacteroidota bacterium]
MNHYRLLSISVVLLVLMLAGGIQNSKAQNLHWGFTGGMTISSHTNDFLYIEDDIDLQLSPNVAIGYNIGAIARTKISRIVRFQAEPSLILLGAKYDDTFTLRGTEFETDSRTELTYAQLPLLIQISTAPSQRTVYGRQKAKTTFHISTGVFGSYLLDARFQGTNSGAPIGIEFEGDFSNDVTAQYAEYDAGAIFGFGFEHGEGNKLGLETRAQFSVIDSGVNENDLFTFEPQNMAITISLYFLF